MQKPVALFLVLDCDMNMLGACLLIPDMDRLVVVGLVGLSSCTEQLLYAGTTLICILEMTVFANKADISEIVLCTD